MADYQLEIHHVDVSGGDATLIVVSRVDGDVVSRVRYTILVDTGGMGSGPRKLLAYLDTYFPQNKIDLFIATHYHDDHIKGVGYVVEKVRLIRPETILDIGVTKEAYHPAETVIYDATLKRQPGYIKKYIAFSKPYGNDKRFVPHFLKSSSYQNGELLNKDPVSNPILVDGVDTGFRITYWSAKGVTAAGDNILADQAQDSKINVNANDLSVSFTIHNTITGFSYFSGGDLSGDFSMKEYYNVEGPTLELVAKMFNNGVKVAKATHHGSDRNNHSNASVPKKKSKSNKAPGFFEILKPETLIIPCNQDKAVPGAAFIQDRLRPYLVMNEKNRAYFFNKFSYKRGAGSIYTALSNLFQSKAGHCTNIQIDEKKKIIAKPLSAIIVSTSSAPGNKIYTKADYFKTSVEARVADSYFVHFNERILKESTANMGETSDLVFDIKAKHLAKDLTGSIATGFSLQADEIITKLQTGTIDNRIKVITEDFPSLLACLKKSPDDVVIDPEYIKSLLIDSNKLRNALRDEMMNTLQRAYIWKLTEWILRAQEEIKPEDETTLINLLSGNRYQIMFFAQRYYMNPTAIKVMDYMTLDRWSDGLPKEYAIKCYHDVTKTTLKRPIEDVDEAFENYLKKTKISYDFDKL